MPLKSIFPFADILGVLSPLPNDGFLNLKDFNLSKILVTDFGSVVLVSSVGVVTFFTATASGVFSTGGVSGAGVVASTGVVVCSVVADGCSVVTTGVSCCAASSFPLFAWTSSNHFSKTGIASSRLGVPDEEIFCFPSI